MFSIDFLRSITICSKTEDVHRHEGRVNPAICIGAHRSLEHDCNQLAHCCTLSLGHLGSTTRRSLYNSKYQYRDHHLVDYYNSDITTAASMASLIVHRMMQASSHDRMLSPCFCSGTFMTSQRGDKSHK